MALQVWLPLNGTLENKGINQCTFINSGAVINDNGKIGQCYDITNGSIYCPNFSLSNTTFSVFCWVKFTSFANNNNAYMVSLSNQGTTAEEIQFFLGIYKASANDYAQISINLGSNKFGQLYTDTWYHIGLTCQNNTVLIYLNGQYIGTRNISAYAQQHLVIGGRSDNSSSTSFVGRPRAVINDVRIYNHCLSSLEVKEIAQGLILHYKLDENINNNLINVFPAITSMSTWASSSPKATKSVGSSTDPEYIYNYPQKTASYYFGPTSNSADNSYVIYYNTPVEASTLTRSMQFIIKEQNGTPITNSVCWPAWNNRDTTGPESLKWTRIIPLRNNFYLCQMDGLKQTSNDLVDIGCSKGYRIYVSEAWCENDKQICSNPPIGLFQQNQIIDSSGYSHHGTIIGNVQTVIDNKSRYNKCIYISSGNTDYLETINTIGNPEDSLTINLWFKSQSTSGGAGYHSLISPINSEPRKIEFAVYCSNGYFRQGIRVNGTRYVTNYSPNILDNNWHMVTMTYDGVNVRRYVDAVLKGTVAAQGVLEAKNNRFRIGRFGNSEGFYSVESYFSDIRVYATALDDNAIKNLYNIGMKIDNLNNIHTFEYKEQDNANIKLYKIGQLLTDEINEISGNTQFKKTGQIYAPEFIER